MHRHVRRVRGGDLVLVATFLAVFAAQPPPVGAQRVVPSTDGVPIAYEVHGTGTPTVVLVHGWSCDRSYWEAQVGPLSEQFRVVTVDLAGHGDSGLRRQKWTMASFGADVAAVVEEEDLQQVILVGHSMGGDVVVAAARRLPERVKGLVWVDAYDELGDPRTDEEVRQRVAPFRGDFVGATREFVRGMFPAGADSSLVRRVVTDMSSAPPAVAIEALESRVTHQPMVLETLQELDVPVIAINPESPPTNVESMERYGVEVVTMSGVGHFLMMEKPAVFNRELTDVIHGHIGRD